MTVRIMKAAFTRFLILVVSGFVTSAQSNGPLDLLRQEFVASVRQRTGFQPNRLFTREYFLDKPGHIGCRSRKTSMPITSPYPFLCVVESGLAAGRVPGSLLPNLRERPPVRAVYIGPLRPAA